MRKYFFYTPGWIQWMYQDAVWKVPTQEKALYFTFDDGPNPEVTPYVLGVLKKFNAKATFFCIGKNVKAFPDLFQAILDAGHQVGNHTYHHLNGCKTNDDKYLEDIELCDRVFYSQLFRPPYGKVRRRQRDLIKTTRKKIIMWTYMAGDFDQSLRVDKAIKKLSKPDPGSVFVFHDHVSAFKNLQKILPVLLGRFEGEGFLFKPIEYNATY